MDDHTQDIVGQNGEDCVSSNDPFSAQWSTYNQIYKGSNMRDPLFDSPGNSHNDVSKINIGDRSQILQTHMLELDASNIGHGLELDEFIDQDMTEFDYQNSDEGQISIHLLAESEEERTHIDILQHSIYTFEALYILCLACCLSDSNHQLALKLANLLQKQHKHTSSITDTRLNSLLLI